MDLNQIIGAASSAQAGGRFEEASRLCGQVLAAEPNNTQAMLLMGVIEAKVGDPANAIRTLDQVQRLDPSSFQAPYWLSFALRNVGNFHAALDSAQDAIQIKPGDAQGLAQVGICLQDLRLLPEAEARLRSSLAISPNAASVQFQLCLCLMMQGKRREAVEMLESILCRGNQDSDAVLSLAQHLLSQGSPALAAIAASDALKKSPQSAKALAILGRTFLEDNRATEAEPLLRKAAEIGDDGQSKSLLGTALQGLGKLDEAIQSFKDSIASAPDQAFGYFGYVSSDRVKESDRPLLAKMAELLRVSSLPPRQVSQLQYGLGKGHEDLREYAQSMTAYDAANLIERELKFKGRAFDRDAYRATFDRTMSQFSRSFIERNVHAGLPNDLPIFVVGMMRSGTTLVEQILSSHPQVGAAGEQPFWLDNWRAVLDEANRGLNSAESTRVGGRYLQLLSEIAPWASRVVDKMPVNYAGLGVIHSVFPRAKIIHTRRNPLDTCLSIYVTPNRAATEYAHDKSNIAFAYRQYLRIMEHWRQVLPPGAMLEMDYEELVTKSEPTIRRIVDFCGLDWDDACLNSSQNKRSVVTPSVWQVRQPLYQSSIERWRNFEPWLGDILDLQNS